MKFFEDFKKFAFKGNVIDMAVGVVIGGAFGKIVSSLVADIITPCISLLTGNVSLVERTVILKVAEEEANNIVLKYGQFLQNIIDFFIIALSIFIFVKIIAGAKSKAEKIRKAKEAEEIAAAVQEPVAPPEPSAEEKLLTEIRDLLKEKNEK